MKKDSHIIIRNIYPGGPAPQDRLDAAGAIVRLLIAYGFARKPETGPQI